MMNDCRYIISLSGGKDSGLTPEQGVHEVKILSKYFEQVKIGAKTFEYRKDDRGYKVGDIIRLMEYQLESNTYTGNSLEAEITYILKGGEFNIPTGYAIMSIKKVIGANIMISPANPCCEGRWCDEAADYWLEGEYE